MKKLILLAITFFIVNALPAQDFIIEKQKGLVIPSKDSCVYRVKGFDQLFERFEKKTAVDAKIHLIFSKEFSTLCDWCDWLTLRVLPEDILSVIDTLPEKYKPYNYLDRKEQDSYRGLMIKLYFDRQGNIFTAEFYIAQELKDKITDKRLKEIYNTLLKEKVPARILQALKSVKDFKGWNSECFHSCLYVETKKGRNQIINDPKWQRQKAKFDREAHRNKK